jgi:uncharacterized protein (TIGR00106 family)|nr:MTH1187 family thiamine-binding protein [Methanobacterium sp. SMA-27]
MITAELTIIPIGTHGTSLSEYIAAAVTALDSNDIKYELTGMGTLIESDNLDKIFVAINAAHEAVFNAGAERVATSIKIDERRDVNKTIKDKITSVTQKLS